MVFGLWDIHHGKIGRGAHTHKQVLTAAPTNKLTLYAYGFIILIWTYHKPMFKVTYEERFRGVYHGVKGTMRLL